MSNGNYNATYAYLANSPLVSQITLKSNATTRVTTAKAYDNLNRLRSIQSSVGASPVASFNYTYNDANQRVRVNLADGSFWIYEYDSLGQVSSGKRYWNDGTPVAGQQFEYAQDDIGNRTSTRAGGDEVGANLRSATYGANNLNQYTNRTVAGAVDVIGVSSAGATVTVNTQAVYRRVEYYRKELAISNTTTSLWPSVTNKAVQSTTTNTVIGAVFVPKTPEVLTHDADGNLTNDGRWTLAWDAENRLINLTGRTNIPTAAKLKLDLTYDYMGRRLQKIVSTNNGTAYFGQSTNRFVYDGWNLAAVLNQTNGLLYSFTWGTDLSGTRQGAGGVGGLLAITVHLGTNAGTYFYCYDGNGNVAAMVNATNGAIAAQYEYGPFGEVIRATGPMAKVNPFRFSTKYQDDETDFLYYGYRYYNPSTGRWLSTDPIGERGGVNLYGFVGNSPQNYLDPLGLDINVITGSVSVSVPCCAEKDKVTIGLIVRGKYSEGHNPGVMAQHADATLADGSLVGFFGSGGGHSGFGMKGVVADKSWFDANRPYYNNADLAKKYVVVSTYCTLRVCPDAAKKFADAWKNLGSKPPNFSIMGGNCSSRAGGCFQSAGILDGGVSGLDTPNHLFQDLRAKYGSSLKCQTGFFGYNAAGSPYVTPLPPGAPTSPNTKNTSDATVSQGSPSSN